MDKEENKKKEKEWQKNWNYYKSIAMLTDYTLRIAIIGTLIAGTIGYIATGCTRHEHSKLEQTIEQEHNKKVDFRDYSKDYVHIYFTKQT